MAQELRTGEGNDTCQEEGVDAPHPFSAVIKSIKLTFASPSSKTFKSELLIVILKAGFAPHT